MSRFLTRAVYEALTAAELFSRKADRQIYVLKEALVYQSDAFGTLVAPAGMETDLASIPRPAWAILDPEDPCVNAPSTIHDAGYTFAGRIRRDGPPLTRAEMDAVLREAMLACFAPSWKATLVYNNVRWFGGGHWVG